MLPAARAKNGVAHFVPLSGAAREVLASVTRIDNAAGYILTTTGRTAVSGFSRAKINLDKAMAEAALKERGEPVEIPHWIFHDLRRTAGTGMAERGVLPHVIERVLNHSLSGARVTHIYNRHSYADEKREALETWGKYVTSLVTGRADNVIRIGEAASKALLP